MRSPTAPHREMGHDAQLSVQSWEQRMHSSENDSSVTYCIWNVVYGLDPESHFLIHKMGEYFLTGLRGISK